VYAEILQMKALLLLLLLPINGFGISGPVDSLKYALTQAHGLEEKIMLNAKLSDAYSQLNLIDSALYYNKVAGDLAASDAEIYASNKAHIFLSRVIYFVKNQQFEEATEEALKLFKDTADVTIFSDYNKMVLCEYYSVILRLKNKPKEAIVPLQRALDIGKKNGRQLGSLYHNMGAIFYQISDYKKARGYFDLAKRYDDIDSVVVNSSIVLTYLEEKNNEKAFQLLKTMISENDTVTIENYKLFTILGSLYLEKENYDLAIPIFQAAAAFMDENNIDIYDIVDNHTFLGEAYILKYEATKNESYLNESRFYIEKGLSGVKQTNRLASKVDLYFNLTKVLIYQGQSEEAIKTFNMFREAQDSLYNKETSAKVEELDVKYQASEKQKKIAILRAEKIQAEAEHKKENNKLIIIISLIVIVSLSLLFLFLNTQSKKKRVEQKLQIESLKKQELKSQLRLKEKELNNSIMLISEKNMLINSLKEQSKGTNSSLDTIIKKFEQNYITDKEWDDIQLQFDSINNGLIEKIQREAGKLTSNDIKLFILLKLRYSNNTMAEILNISYEGVKKAKQRLNKKINLEKFIA